MLAQSDAGRRFAMPGLTQLPQQRCKRAKYDANHLARDLQKLAVDGPAQNSQGASEPITQPCSWQARPQPGACQAVHDPATELVAQGLAQLQCNNRALPTAESDRNSATGWSCPATQQPRGESPDAESQEAQPMCSDEFDEELSYLASQVELSGNGSSPAQAMPYIF